MTKSPAGQFLFTRGTPASETNPRVWDEFFSTVGGPLSAGYWSSLPGRIDLDYDNDEICILLEGVIKLTDQSGESATYNRGDTFFIPRGFKGVWETVESAQKFYVQSGPTA
jgi:uncharacterized cupin superfamily protein